MHSIVIRLREREINYYRAKEENIPKGLEPSAKCTNSKYLQSLLEMCFRQFDDVVLSHSLLLKYLKKAKQTYKG